MVEELLSGLALPSQRIFYVHARLRNLQAQTGMSYAELSKQIIDELLRHDPVAILVPVQTLRSFMMSGVFHRRFSRSEEGRFSEEVRVNHARHRTSDPMYSVADVTGFLREIKDIDYTRTFGPGTLFHYLLSQNTVIVNIDMHDDMRMMTHEPEFNCGVDYRFDKDFEGIVYLDERTWHRVKYRAWLRHVTPDGIEYPDYDRTAIRDCFVRAGVLHTHTHGVEATWMAAEESCGALDRGLAVDPRCLVAA
jgi:aminoglycoside N3'-acetyltransferase